ncbi:MAG: biotin/lipoyl-binding protein, partial [Pseudomonadota bacterium]
MATTTVDASFERALYRPSATIWLVTLTVVAFLVWAAFAWVDEIVRAEGEIVSQSRPQIIQNLEGGILAELMVAEGDIVQPGDVLARLYATKFQTQVDDLAEQIAALDIRRLRLEAEMAGFFEFTVPDTLAIGNESIVTS